MLEKSFRITKGIGEITEKKLWNIGIKTWDDVLKKKRPTNISRNLWKNLKKDVFQYQRLLSEDDYKALNQIIPSTLTWRAIPNFQGKIAFLDIETTGLSYHDSQITTIAVFDGRSVHTFVHGKNLDEFKPFIGKFPAIASFYGKGFDVPFIENYLGVDMPQLHFDTCFLLRKVGFRGGLKSIEQQLKISRGIMSKLDGYCAVLLWKRYRKTGDERYLETLLAYNAEDVLNLEFLLNFAYNEISLKEDFPYTPMVIEKRTAENPFRANENVVDEILNMNTGYGWY